MSGVTIITGASSGIGKDLALQLAAGGGTFHLIGQDPERVAQVTAEVQSAGATAHGHACDLTDFDAVEKWFEALVADGAEIDALYHCAGRAVFGEVAEQSLRDLKWIYHTNLLSCAQWISMVFPRMARRGSGTIVLVSSLSAYSGFPMATSYAATKQALVTMCRSIWPEARDAGVGLHVACPGFVTTGLFKAAHYADCSRGEVMECIRKLGFPFISSPRAATLLLKGVRRGRRLIVFPFYAKFMCFLGYRVPGLVNVFHRRVVRTLQEAGSETPGSAGA